MKSDGSAWSLTRADGTNVAMTGTGTAADAIIRLAGAENAIAGLDEHDVRFRRIDAAKIMLEAVSGDLG